MPRSQVAILEVGKVVAGISLPVFAAVGSAIASMTGNPVLAAFCAGGTALPSAIFTSSSLIVNQIETLKSKGESKLKIASPVWWNSDVCSWQDVCDEVIDHFPAILTRMELYMRQDEDIKTMERARQIFIDALATEHLTWAPNVTERKKIGNEIALPIFQALDEVLKPVIQQIQQEEALQDYHDTATNTRETTEILKEIRDSNKPAVLSDDEVVKLRHQYCSKLFETWKMLDFRGITHVEMNRPMSIPLTEVFVYPDVLVGVPEYETLEREEESKNEDTREKRSEKYLEYERVFKEHRDDRSGKVRRKVLQREELSVVLGKSRYLVILGDPGAGKSTLLRYLLLRLVGNRDLFIKDFPRLVDASSAIPVYMALAQYADTWRTNELGERSLINFLPNYLRDNYLEEFIPLVKQQIERGEVLFLFDGLDEIPDISLRNQIVRQVEAFTRTYPNNYYIVSSRIVGYRDASLAGEYEPYTLADFNEKQIGLFAGQWCPAYERWVRQATDNQQLQEAATKEAERLFRATQHNPGVRRLATNPLLLTILALIQRQGIDLPSHRVELYELCATTLLETWIKTKGQSIPFSKLELIKILCPLAFWMHQHPAVGAIPEEELIEQIVKQLLNRKIARYEGEAEKLASQFMDTIRGKTGILVERGKGRYGFLHQTFEEYFAASQLVKHNDRSEFIQQHLHSPRWREVILLAVGIIGILQRNEEAVTELVENAIMQADSQFDEYLHRDLLFAGLCLADDVGVSVSCEDDIIEQIVYLYLTCPYDSLREGFSKLLQGWSGMRVGKRVVSLILSMFNNITERIDVEEPALAFSSIALSPIEKKMEKYTQILIHNFIEDRVKLAQLQMILVLGQLEIEVGDPISCALLILSDSNSSVRQAAAEALGQVDVGQTQTEVVEVLLKLLSDIDVDVRQAAARALGQVGAEQAQAEVVEALLKLLSDTNSSVRQAVAEALGQVGAGQAQAEVVEALLKLLSDSDWSVRQAAAEALGQVGAGQAQAEVVEALLKLLSDIDIDVRQAAAEALEQVGAEQAEVVEALLKLLSDIDIDVRQAAVRALEQVGAEQAEVVEALLKLLADTDSSVRQAAAEALEQVGAEQAQAEVVEALLKLLSDSDWSVRQAAAGALGQVSAGQTEVVEALLKLLADTNSSVRRAAVRALGQVSAEQAQAEVVEALLKLLSDSDWSVRQAAAGALGQVSAGQTEVVEALLKLLADTNSSVRRAAVRALGQVSAEQTQAEVVEALLKLLSDSNSSVRRAAVRALGQVSAEQTQAEVVEALLKLLSDTDEDVRQAVAETLGQVSAEQTQAEVVEALLKLLSDTDEDVRQAAAEVLGQMGSENFSVVRQLEDTFPNISKSNLLIFVIANYVHDLRASLTLRQLSQLQLVGVGQAEVVEALLKLHSDTNSSVRRAVAEALGQVGAGQAQAEVVEALLKLLADTDSSVRRAAAEALGQVGAGQTEVVEALLKLLSDTDEDVRQAAAEALGQVSAEQAQAEVVEALLKLLSDTNSSVRRAVAEALGQVGAGQAQAEVVEALLKLLSDSDWSVRYAAVRALGQVSAEQTEVVEALLKLLSDTDEDVRQAAAEALGQVSAEQAQAEVVEALLKLLSDTNSSVRRAVAEALGQVGAEQTQAEVVEALLKLLSDTNWSVRQAAAEALGQVSAEQTQAEVVEALLKLLADTNSSVRQAAAEALGQVSAEQAQAEVVETLLKLLSDTNWSVRRAVAEALGQVGAGQAQAEVVEALLKLLSDSDEDVRRAAAEALEQVSAGQAQAEVVEALLKLLSDSDENVRKVILNGLLNLHIDRLVIASRIENLLKTYHTTLEKQLVANDIPNGLLLALQQVVGEV